uniref:Uncharacterized protein n=1 Tax=Cacopsylla melanoneura TaxID=428564 RepID=A0A8D9A6J2_9HEMI
MVNQVLWLRVSSYPKILKYVCIKCILILHHAIAVHNLQFGPLYYKRRTFYYFIKNIQIILKKTFIYKKNVPEYFSSHKRCAKGYEIYLIKKCVHCLRCRYEYNH